MKAKKRWAGFQAALHACVSDPPGKQKPTNSFHLAKTQSVVTFALFLFLFVVVFEVESV